MIWHEIQPTTSVYTCQLVYTILRKRYKWFVILLSLCYDTQGLMSAELFYTGCWWYIQFLSAARRQRRVTNWQGYCPSPLLAPIVIRFSLVNCTKTSPLTYSGFRWASWTVRLQDENWIHNKQVSKNDIPERHIRTERNARTESSDWPM